MRDAKLFRCVGIGSLRHQTSENKWLGQTKKGRGSGSGKSVIICFRLVNVARSESISFTC